MSRVIVTDGAGHCGCMCAKHLHDLGSDVVALDARREQRVGLTGPGSVIEALKAVDAQYSLEPSVTGMQCFTIIPPADDAEPVQVAHDTAARNWNLWEYVAAPVFLGVAVVGDLGEYDQLLSIQTAQSDLGYQPR